MTGSVLSAKDTKRARRLSLSSRDLQFNGGDNKQTNMDKQAMYRINRKL